jgi:hypothetical protein
VITDSVPADVLGSHSLTAHAEQIRSQQLHEASVIGPGVPSAAASWAHRNPTADQQTTEQHRKPTDHADAGGRGRSMSKMNTLVH